MKKHLSIMLLLLLLPAVIASSPVFPFDSKGYSDAELMVGQESIIAFEISPSREWITTMEDYEVSNITFFERICVEVPRPKCTENLDDFVIINHTVTISDDKIMVEVLVRPVNAGIYTLTMQTILNGPSSPSTLLNIPVELVVEEENILDDIVEVQNDTIEQNGDDVVESDEPTDDIDVSGDVPSETVEQKSFFTKLVGWFRNTFSFGN